MRRPIARDQNQRKRAAGSQVANWASGYPSFTPASLPNLALWLDAADTATITESSGAVSQWNDKSGNGRHVSQATGANQPATGTVTQNNRNVLSFTADNKFMTHDAGSDAISVNPMTYFAVVYDNSTLAASAFKRILSMRRSLSSSDFDAPNFTSNKNNLAREFEFRAGGTSGFGNQSSPVGLAYTNQAWWIGSIVATSTGGFHQVNNNARSATTNNLAIGGIRYIRVGQVQSTGNPPGTIAGNGWIGSIAEIVLFNRQLTEPEIDLMKQYLLSKWGPFS